MDNQLQQNMSTIQRIVTNAEFKIKYETGIKIKLVIVNNEEPVDIDAIINETITICCKNWDVEVEYIMDRTRTRDRVTMRSIIFHILRVKYKVSFTTIAKRFNCDHTSVIHNVTVLEDMLLQRDELVINYYTPIKYLYDGQV